MILRNANKKTLEIKDAECAQGLMVDAISQSSTFEQCLGRCLFYGVFALLSAIDGMVACLYDGRTHHGASSMDRCTLAFFVAASV